MDNFQSNPSNQDGKTNPQAPTFENESNNLMLRFKKGFTPFILVLVVLLIFAVIIGTFFYLKNSNILQNQSKEMTSERTSTNKPSDKTKERILFESKGDIYSIKVDGVELKKLTENQGNNSSVLSPDGKHIAFISLSNSEKRFNSCSGDNCELYLMDSDGSNIKRLTYTEDVSEEDPAWSPDGNWIAFTSRSIKGGTNTNVDRINISSLKIENLTDEGTWGDPPQWSLDGKQIVFRSLKNNKFELYIMNSDGTNAKKLAGVKEGDYYPRWSPDGKRISFISSRDDKVGIYVMNTDGSNVKKIVDSQFGDYSMQNVSYSSNFSWSPDGKKIVFNSDRNGQYSWQIFIVNSDGSELRQLTSLTDGAGSPVWSPDGNWILFTSVKGFGEYDLYIMDQNGSNIKRLTDGSNASWLPTSSP